MGDKTARIAGNVADGAAAVANEIDSKQSLVTSGAKVLSVKNAGAEVLAINKDGDITLSGTVDGVDIAAHDHSSGTAQTRLAALDRRRFAPSEKHDADSAAGDATAEHIFLQAQEALTVTKVFFLPDAALTAVDTNFATLTVYRRDASGGTQVTVASITTQVADGNWVAFDGKDLGTITNAAVATGLVLTWEITKSGSGIIVPAGTLQVEYTID